MNSSGIVKSSVGRKLLTVVLPIFLVVILVIGLNHHSKSSSSEIGDNFNKKQYSLNQVSSLWVIVNKARILPNTYAPSSLINPKVGLRLAAADPEMKLRSDAAAALESMFADASAHNIKLMLGSGYRSYSEQTQIFEANVKAQGGSVAEQSSARPGFSEHQTGLAADIEPTDRSCEFRDCFADTSEGTWLALNSYRYGFIIRYPKNSQQLTGYEYEPWHVRFVGKELATEVHKTHQTLEQFFDLPVSQDYGPSPYHLQ